MAGLPEWTFRSVPFYLVNPDKTKSIWVRQGRYEVHNWAGTGTAEFATFGFMEYRLQAQVYLSSEIAASALEGYHLTSGILTDGETGTWSDVILLEIRIDRKHPGRYEGTLEFGRSG